MDTHPLLLTELALLIGLDAPFGSSEGAADKLDIVRQCKLSSNAEQQTKADIPPSSAGSI